MSVMKLTEKHDNLIYDVGMHKGEDTDYYLRKGFRVIGFEADPELAEHCRQRFADEIRKEKLKIVEGAITEIPIEKTAGNKIRFFRNKKKSIWGTVDNQWAHRNELLGSSIEIIEVPVVDFSGCLLKYGIPHYLKIDIEGMDIICLKALRSFEQKPDYISIESEKISFEKLTEEIDLLMQLGYNRFKAIQQLGISFQKEPNPSQEGVYVGYQFSEGCSGIFGKDLPGIWKDNRQIINQYKAIFRQYRLFGDYGKLRRTLAFKILKRLLWKLLRKPLPGWYDTHAKHSSVIS